MKKVRVITDENEKEVAVIVPIKTWERLLDQVETAEDEREAKQARRENKYVSFEEVKRQIYAH